MFVKSINIVILVISKSESRVVDTKTLCKLNCIFVPPKDMNKELLLIIY